MFSRHDLPALRRLARFAAQRCARDRVPQVAGSLTFTTVLSIVPLITVAFAIFTAFPIFASFQDAVQNFLSDRLMPPSVNQQIFEYLNEFAAKAKALTTAGMVFLVLTSLITMMTIESALNVIWRVRKPRPLVQRLLIYWAVLTLAPVIFGISVSLSTYLLTQSMSRVSGALEVEPTLKQWVLSFAALPITAAGFTLLYVFVPNCRVAWKDALIGGCGAALAIEVTKRGFGLYIRHFPTYTAVYGAFAAIPIFLIWVYLSWFITLFGATLTSALPAIRAGHFFRPRFTGSDLFDALAILARLVRARDMGRFGYNEGELTRMLRRDLDTTTRLLAALEQRQWIARLHRDGTPERWLLIANPATITLAALIDAFVIDRDELAYQASLESSRVDADLLLSALHHEGLTVTLRDLMHAREQRTGERTTGRVEQKHADLARLIDQRIGEQDVAMQNR
ncbi:YihY family inner membrane protein [Robbsia andropogonis]|uniref:YihY family inner membrane protein n=1 Tax=Robbsia andropogonis TaxID=28092 RepID=UPI000467DE01|nr:YihY family inner membrane protein [Robbsia andropogonis]MCP1119820.1 YihY family inner membrane protein [Robbsia andropogonis]MCP1128853.1 YihY family inner membrane protein [Robbsia andropogonis]